MRKYAKSEELSSMTLPTHKCTWARETYRFVREDRHGRDIFVREQKCYDAPRCEKVKKKRLKLAHGKLPHS